jgi:chlorobactene glucosyltransferase
LDTLTIAYHLFILAGLLLALVGVIANVANFGGLREVVPPADDDAPLVSILVPARNEARCIGPCVSSLLAQDYPNFELIMLDDHSEDGTGEIARRLGLGEMGDRRVIAGEALPAGWTGKGWACHQLSRAAKGHYLFFTDADTTHAPGTVSAAVAKAREDRADLLSAWPRLITETWSEKLVVPMVVFLGMVIYPHWLVVLLQRLPSVAARLPDRERRLLGAANGQFIFFTRAAYDRIGGHAAIRDHLVEDVALGRAVAARMGEGMRFLNCDALQFSTCRMYESFPQVWEGFTKNTRAAFEESLAGFFLIGGIQLCGFLLPFVLVFVPGPAQWLVVLQIAVIYLIRVVLTVRFRTSWMGCILHPVGVLLSLAIGLNSWRKLATKGVTWKGRVYQSS